jgi:uncharacterized protein (DUF1800 family)
MAAPTRRRLLDDPSLAWEPYEPGTSDAWGLPHVAHLHRRAGFPAPWDVLQRDIKDGPEASVRRLLDGEPTALDGVPAAEFEAFQDGMSARLALGGEIRPLQAAWLYRMIFTPHPLRERMTLFWHDHFATSNAKVNNPGLMWRQVDMLRGHALGDFKVLLKEMARDPAMLVWLDSTSNRKAHPNENYAREVMELFTLGRGRYTEKDIQEAARAFTGSFVRGDRFSHVAREHDPGAKTILGRSGAFGGDDVADILLGQEACAEFLCGKLYRQFVSEVDEPSSELIAPLAEAFRTSGYDVKVPVRTILRSRLFHDPGTRRKRVKSPVELVVGTVRSLEILGPTVSVDALAESCERMGQALYAPPSVAGWDKGPAWINTTSSLARTNLALALLSDDAKLGKRLDPRELARRHDARSADDVARFYVDLLVQDAFDETLRKKVASSARAKKDDPGGPPREAAALVLAAPEYQLA